MRLANAFKAIVKNRLPFLPCNYGQHGVAQLFLNTAKRKTRFALTNFPSLFAPASGVDCRYEISLFSSAGDEVFSKEIRLPPRGSKEIIPEEMTSKPLPDYGMFTAVIRFDAVFRHPYLGLGNLSSHFYTMFADDEGNPCGLVHPQILLGSPDGKLTSWRSNLAIPTGKLLSIEAYQINPTAERVSSKVSLNNSSEELLTEECGEIPAMGARRILWPSSLFTKAEDVHISAVGLPTINAKPIVFLNFENGVFSTVHS